MTTQGHGMKKDHAMQGAAVPVTFKRQWDDGYGARGWKLDSSAHDPEVIASTAFPGESIPTSVLIHDILDHLISGFGPSGHRNEAMALAQLQLRTGSYIRPDLEQMIDEDILHGTVIGESLESFLPGELLRHLSQEQMSDKQKMDGLIAKLGREEVRASLLKRFYELGEQGIADARKNWQRLGLDHAARMATGLCLQALLVKVDNYVSTHDVDQARGEFVVGKTACAMRLSAPERFHALLPIPSPMPEETGL